MSVFVVEAWTEGDDQVVSHPGDRSDNDDRLLDSLHDSHSDRLQGCAVYGGQYRSVKFTRVGSRLELRINMS